MTKMAARVGLKSVTGDYVCSIRICEGASQNSIFVKHMCKTLGKTTEVMIQPDVVENLCALQLKHLPWA